MTTSLPQDAMARRRRRTSLAMSPKERMALHLLLQEAATAMISPEGLHHFHRRNHQKRRIDVPESST